MGIEMGIEMGEICAWSACGMESDILCVVWIYTSHDLNLSGVSVPPHHHPPPHPPGGFFMFMAFAGVYWRLLTSGTPLLFGLGRSNLSDSTMPVFPDHSFPVFGEGQGAFGSAVDCRTGARAGAAGCCSFRTLPVRLRWDS